MMQCLRYKNRLLLIMVMVVAVLASCKKQDLPVKPQPSPFAAMMENNATNFPAGGGAANIIVSGGTDGWWVMMPSNNWCNITKVYGSGDFKIPVTIKPNTTGTVREITVKISPTFNLQPVTIKLTQAN